VGASRLYISQTSIVIVQYHHGLSLVELASNQSYKLKKSRDMKVKLTRSYRSQKGNTVFVYSVTGSESQIEAYKAAQGDNYRETDEGVALWFTTRCIGERGTLIITDKGKVLPDMSAFEQAASMAKQFGGNFGAELARASVAKLLGHDNDAANGENIDKL